MQLLDGTKVDRLLTVDKDQVLMEVLGAVQELNQSVVSSDCKQPTHLSVLSIQEVRDTE